MGNVSTPGPEPDRLRRERFDRLIAGPSPSARRGAAARPTAGASIQLANASIEVRDLLTAVGLADVLPIVRSGVREIVPVDGKVEEREEVWIDEVVDRGNPAV